MIIKELNTSYTQITAYGSQEQQRLDELKQILKAERDGWRFDYLVRIGRRSKYDYFYEETTSCTIVVNSGVLEIPVVRDLLGLPELNSSTDEEVEEFLESILQEDVLPFAPYDYQIEACKQALSKKRKLSLMCTGSGKSLTISLCLEYFRRKDLKGVLVVPNINLLTQFASDIKSYNLDKLYNSIITLGGGSKRLKQLNEQQVINSGDLIITTWQSLTKLEPKLFREIDYIICDEVHRFSSKCTAGLVQSTGFAKYKLGFTGTLPDAKTQKMTLVGLFGLPETFITSNELIEQGRGTPIHITGVKVKHTADNSYEISKYGEFLDKVQHVIAIPERTQLIADIALQASKQANGSTLVLFTFIEHGEMLYRAIAGLSENDPIPKLEQMQEVGVYFLTGQSTAKEREAIRQLMDQDPKAILIANYALLSTGVNIKSLRYAIFASPVKSGVVTAQSLGRGIRKSNGKDQFNVYDIVDVLSGTGMFVRQYSARKKVYQKSQFTLDERLEELN